MASMLCHWPRSALLFGLTVAVVDESGRYRQGSDISSFGPPEPSEADRNASVDLSKEPIDRIFKLLAFELVKEEKRPPDRRFGIRDFQLATELTCEEQMVRLMQEAETVSQDVKAYHLNVTGTAGLYWLLHQYPEEHSWAWLLAISHDRVLRKVGQHFLRLATLATDDAKGCLSTGYRTTLMNAAATWKRLHGDQTALLWNGVAFGVLGDVTAWREVDENGTEVEEGPGGPPPNVSWSENIIFGNMWISSVEKWLEHHAQELAQATYNELARAQTGLPKDDRPSWRQGSDGVFSTFDYLRRQLFGGWDLDKGLLRGMLRHCLKPEYGWALPVSVADFGAGGGRYSEWLNDTGLVEAFAMDATQAVEDITGKTVLEVNLASDLRLWRTFDWVLSLGLGAGMPVAHASALLHNVRRHAKHGLVISWPDQAEAANEAASSDALDESGLVALVGRETGFQFDEATTKLLRRACEFPRLAETVAVFRAPAPGRSEL